MTVFEVVSFAKDLANKGQGVDFDKAWGRQCVDLPNWICGSFFGKALWGNAIDLLDSAEQQGMEVHRNPTTENPRAGACFVKDYIAGDGVNYGHTGLIIGVDGDVAETVEQNLVGNLWVGGPAQYSTQRVSDLVGWFYPPYEDSDNAHYTRELSGNVGKIKDEIGTMIVQVSLINVRNQPSIEGTVVATYGYGEKFYYDSVYIADGYVWVSYISSSGQRRYVAAGEEENRRNVVPYGVFE